MHVGERERQHDFCHTQLISVASQLFRREQLMSAAVARPPAELDLIARNRGKFKGLIIPKHIYITFHKNNSVCCLFEKNESCIYLISTLPVLDSYKIFEFN